MLVSTETINGLKCFKLQNKALTLTVCPEAGGKINSLIVNEGQKELLWNNPELKLRKINPGEAYDPNFFGGIDELLPNDEQETINGVEYPDHGELWTMALKAECVEEGLKCSGALRTGFAYERLISLDGDSGRIFLDYRLKNLFTIPNPFLFKMHAALKLAAGDTIICPAGKGQIGDEDFTNRHGKKFFHWPKWGQDQLDEVLGPDSGKCEFSFLSELKEGFMGHQSRASDTFFNYQFDTNVFPYAWYFASYGGWNDIYTGVLEPATAIPTALSKSIKKNTCPFLGPGEELITRVTISAGRLS